MSFSSQKGEFDRCFNRFDRRSKNLDPTGNLTGRSTRPVSISDLANSDSLQLLKLNAILKIFYSHFGVAVATIFYNTKSFKNVSGIPKKFSETLNLFFQPELLGKKRLNNMYPFSNIT